jgi:hypothetical protein
MKHIVAHTKNDSDLLQIVDSKLSTVCLFSNRSTKEIATTDILKVTNPRPVNSSEIAPDPEENGEITSSIICGPTIAADASKNVMNFRPIIRTPARLSA